MDEEKWKMEKRREEETEEALTDCDYIVSDMNATAMSASDTDFKSILYITKQISYVHVILYYSIIIEINKW